MKLKNLIIKTLLSIYIFSPFLMINPISAGIENYTIRTAVSESWVPGQNDYWQLSPHNEKSEFSIGEKVQFFAQSNYINVPHKWVIKIYLGDTFYREESISYDPGSFGWNYSNYIPTISDLPHGSYKVEYYLDLGYGENFINSINFTVLNKFIDGIDPYTFYHSVTATSWAYGENDEYWNLKPVNQKSGFQRGDDVTLLVQVRDIYLKHRYRVELHREGAMQWNYESEWMNVSEKWHYGNFYPTHYNARPGSYEFRAYIDIGNGFVELAKTPFNVEGEVVDYVYSHTTLATDWKNGVGDDYWNIVPVGQNTVFQRGQDVHALAQVKNIYVNHEWKVEFFKDDARQWEYTAPWNEVGTGWTYGNFFPTYYNAQPGNYSFKIYLNTGSGFVLLDTKAFAVEGKIEEPIISRAVTATGWNHGVGDDYWNLTPVNQKSTFLKGENVFLMTQIKDAYKDHRYKVELYKDGVSQWWYHTEWLYVGSGWAYSNFFPVYYNAQPGTYEFWYYLDTGTGFELKGKTPFTVIQ